MLFYLQYTEAGELHISPTIQGDNHLKISEVLLPGLPLGLALSLVQKIEFRGKQRNKEDVLKSLQKLQGSSVLNYHWDNLAAKRNSQRQNTGCISGETDKDISFRLSSQGRQLSEIDLQRLGQEIGLTHVEVIERCNHQIRLGEAEWIPAVSKEGKGWRCMRCGETRVEEWPSIYGLAATCPACAALGALSSLQVLYRSLYGRSKSSNENVSELNDFLFSPRWELSSAQKEASEEVLDFVTSNNEEGKRHGKEILLWAACGAGKTEVCFPAATWTLKRGLKILFAAPRQDVVHDIAPRLKRDFPGLALSVLTGTSSERFVPGQFVLATTHQVLRFYQTFDLIFLDEMDAFPYHGNAALAWGLHQALKPSGKIIYLTATPSLESLEKAKGGQMKIVRLPARHHRKALPVPEWRKFSWEFKEGEIQINATSREALGRWVEELATGGPVIIFVPKISWVNPLVVSLCKEFPKWEIAGSYSSDPERREKINGLRNKKFRAFVSTSILERGVTVPNAQVIVLEADHEVFDERALVQMAGRVGRTQVNPDGKILFLAKKKTHGMDQAIRWIEEQNELALKKGLIDL